MSATLIGFDFIDQSNTNTDNSTFVSAIPDQQGTFTLTFQPADDQVPPIVIPTCILIGGRKPHHP